MKFVKETIPSTDIGGKEDDDDWWLKGTPDIVNELMRVYDVQDDEHIFMGTNIVDRSNPPDYPVVFQFMYHIRPDSFIKFHILLCNLWKEINEQQLSNQHHPTKRILKIIKCMVQNLRLKVILPLLASHGSLTYGRGYCFFISLWVWAMPLLTSAMVIRKLLC